MNRELAEKCAREAFPDELIGCSTVIESRTCRTKCLAAIESYAEQSEDGHVKVLREYIEGRIDHYAPYRPFMDSPEAKVARLELQNILDSLPSPPKERTE